MGISSHLDMQTAAMSANNYVLLSTRLRVKACCIDKAFWWQNGALLRERWHVDEDTRSIDA
jgi:hypothetical protein